MTFFVIRYGWKYPLRAVPAATGFFFVVDVTFFASNMLKLLAGGWFPIVIGIGMFTLMLTWKQGRRLVSDRLRDDAIELARLPRRGVRQPADARGRARRCSWPPSRA